MSLMTVEQGVGGRLDGLEIFALLGREFGVESQLASCR